VKLTQHSLALLIDQQLLNPDATRHDIKRVCREARGQGFRSVWVHGSRVVEAVALLEESEVKLATVVGFPSGAMEPDAKRYETEVAIDNGAQEVNVVINLGWLKDGSDAAVLRELRDVVEAADERPVGVMLETALLTQAEKVRACELAIDAGAKSVITCTGFGIGEATIEDVKLLRGIVESKLEVTAVGTIPDLCRALALIEAGATRIGTAEGVAIMQQFESGVS